MGENVLTTGTMDWLAAGDDSFRQVRELVPGFGEDQLKAPLYAPGWSIAAVLSHLGNAAEIGTVLLQRGIDSDESAPTPQGTGPVWSADLLRVALLYCAWSACASALPTTSVQRGRCPSTTHGHCSPGN